MASYLLQKVFDCYNMKDLAMMFGGEIRESDGNQMAEAGIPALFGSSPVIRLDVLVNISIACIDINLSELLLYMVCFLYYAITST